MSKSEILSETLKTILLIVCPAVLLAGLFMRMVLLTVSADDAKVILVSKGHFHDSYGALSGHYYPEEWNLYFKDANKSEPFATIGTMVVHVDEESFRLAHVGDEMTAREVRKLGY